MPEEKATRAAIRYDVFIATFVGVCALFVSGYTAYMQRQQVRAMVWPILEFDSNNGPISFTLTNKGVGPAIIKHVIVRVDSQPVRDWTEVLGKLLGPPDPGQHHHYAESDMTNRILSPGEHLDILTAHDANDNAVNFDRSNPLWMKLNDERLRVSVEICYASTLGECWTLHAGGVTPTKQLMPSTTIETRRCPTSSEISFEQ